MRQSIQVSAIAAACAASVVVGSIILHHIRVRRGRRFCPGPPRPLWKWLSPWAWFVRPVCGYDLAGLHAESNGAITCPECGRRLASLARAPYSPGRVRWRRLMLTTIALAWAAVFIPYIRYGAWTTDMPNWLVVLHRAALGQQGIPALRRDADRRLSQRLLSPEQSNWLIPTLINDLRKDDIQGNAETAMDHLEGLGIRAVPALERALDSKDWQQRQLAAHILRLIHENLGWDAFVPSPRLLAVTAEGLRDDHFPSEPPDEREHRPYRYSYVYNGREGLNYLARVGAPATAVLRDSMWYGDPQARLLAAGAAGFAGLTDLLPSAAPILVEHLKDANSYRDAEFASSALRSFGPAAMPYLEECVESLDAQKRQAAQLLALGMAAEPREYGAARQSLQVIYHAMEDLALGGAPERYSGRMPELDLPGSP